MADELNKPARQSSILGVLVILLVVLVVVGVAMGLKRHVRKYHDELHGDADSAMAGLTSLMEKTPLDARKPLLMKFVNDEVPGLRCAAVDQLGTLRGADVVDAVEHAYLNSAAMVRQRAMEVMPTLDRSRGRHLLCSALRDDDYWLRDAAISQFCTLVRDPKSGVDKTMVPALMRSLDDPDENVAVLSMSVLKKLTGNNWRVSIKAKKADKDAVVQKWKNWWAMNRAKWPTDNSVTDVAPISPTRMDPAPEFSLDDVDGKRLDNASQRGRVTLLNFWGTWCPWCRAEVPNLIHLNDLYKAEGLDVIGIAVAEKNRASLVEWCAAHGVKYRQAMSNTDIQDDFGSIEEEPVSVMIDKQNRIRYYWVGPRDFATFGAAAERLLRE